MQRVLSLYPPDTIIIEGEYRGADLMSKRIARTLDMTVLPFAADWKSAGPAAGPIRNKRMLDEGKPDLVLAFHSHLMLSKGTKNMVAQAEAAGVPWVCVPAREFWDDPWYEGMLCAFCVFRSPTHCKQEDGLQMWGELPPSAAVGGCQFFQQFYFGEERISL